MKNIKKPSFFVTSCYVLRESKQCSATAPTKYFQSTIQGTMANTLTLCSKGHSKFVVYKKVIVSFFIYFSVSQTCRTVMCVLFSKLKSVTQTVVEMIFYHLSLLLKIFQLMGINHYTTRMHSGERYAECPYRYSCLP